MASPGSNNWHLEARRYKCAFSLMSNIRVPSRGRQEFEPVAKDVAHKLREFVHDSKRQYQDSPRLISSSDPVD